MSIELRMRVGFFTAGTLTSSGVLNAQKSRSLAVTSGSGAVVAMSGAMFASGAPDAIHFVSVTSSNGSTGFTQASTSRFGGGI